MMSAARTKSKGGPGCRWSTPSPHLKGCSSTSPASVPAGGARSAAWLASRLACVVWLSTSGKSVRVTWAPCMPAARPARPVPHPSSTTRLPATLERPRPKTWRANRTEESQSTAPVLPLSNADLRSATRRLQPGPTSTSCSASSSPGPPPLPAHVEPTLGPAPEQPASGARAPELGGPAPRAWRRSPRSRNWEKSVHPRLRRRALSSLTVRPSSACAAMVPEDNT
mmetsp:Transcript_35219/g.109670  ORF Transcript_35219/g.109670 Transcript_35219/m.109670 type:complete len:225 (-) Transcript_35219:153-827(-)